MAKFRNITTGNIIRVKNEIALELVKKSGNYAPYAAEKKGKQAKKATTDPDAGKQPEGSNAQ